MKHINGNIEIAIFMGAEITSCKTPGIEYEYVFYSGFPLFSKGTRSLKKYPYSAETLEYHTSWDWLMEVVEKIEEFGGDENEFDIFGNCVQLGDKSFLGTNKIDAVWKSVIDYLKSH